MPRKPKTPQKEDLVGVSERDNFQTPNYAVDLLVPFLHGLESMTTSCIFTIWECAAGLRKISHRLSEYGFVVASTDITYSPSTNFLTDSTKFPFSVIVTNPPFSLKKKFFLRCLEYGRPFALLIPADYDGWLIEAVEKFGCEKIIPSRRIDYITPRILQRIHEGEIFKLLDQSDFPVNFSLSEYKQEYPKAWEVFEKERRNMFSYPNIYETPTRLLRKYSSSYYHSMWLTWGFGIGRTETFVELTNDQKNNI